jgi:regulator of protease activity HflC (stomatin/prohibitin superfamily)
MRKVLASRTLSLSLLALGALAAGTGCAGATIQPGHRALYFDPKAGGIQHEVLQPGWYRTACPFWEPGNKCPRVDDFDVTFSTSKEEVHTLSAEGLPLDLSIAVVYRPIVAELYMLDTEIGPNYFDEVVGPEFKSAAIGVFAHTSYQDLQKKNGAIEDEVERALRERLKGRHVEISSVLIQKVTYAPEILQSQRERVVSQEETLRNKQTLENEASQKKRELELAGETKKLEVETQSAQRKLELAAQAEQKKMEIEAKTEQEKLVATAETEVKKIQIAKAAEEEKARLESALRNKQAERRLTAEQGQIDRMKAEADASARMATAHGEATSRLALARATAEEKRAEAASITTNQVMMHAYDALGQLGGTGTSIMLGDWSHIPSWLFPRTTGLASALPLYTMPAPPSAASAPAGKADSTLSQTDPNPFR